MSARLGLVNRIIPFSAVDGPGNRLVLFLQGCNFRCINCHNSHTIGHCTLCGQCVENCPARALRLSAGTGYEMSNEENNGTGNVPGDKIDERPAVGIGNRLAKACILYDDLLCRNCDRCLSVCPESSNPRARWLTVEEVVQSIRPVSPFLSGITVSGGEATLQLDFLRQLFTFLRQTSDLSRLTTFVDSNGSLEQAGWETLLPVLDGVMLDLKALDPAVHQTLTSASNQPVLRSIEYLYAVGKLYEVRLLIIPGYNATSEMIEDTARYLARVCPETRIRIIPFRQHGVLPQYAHLEPPDATLLKSIEATLIAQGFSPNLISIT